VLAAANLPDNSGYVAAAYLVLFAMVVIYLGIMTARLSRLERELIELNELADRGREPAQDGVAS
jgi:hypothetical protein